MTIASLIVDVAANTVKLQQDVTKINSTLGSITTVAGKIGGVLAGAFTIRAMTSFVMDLIRTSAELVRVADQTGLTTTEVQKLSYIAGQSGNDLGQLTNALSMLQRKLVGGSDNTVQAVQRLGLNLIALRAASPYEQMEQIATALAKIPDPALRSALATELFGKAGAAVLPTLISNFKELGDAAPLMKDKTVRALEQAGDAFETFTTTVKVWIAEAYNYAGRIFDQLVAKFYDFIAVQLRVTASVLDLAKKIPGATKALDAMGVSTDDLRSAADSFNVTATYMRSKINEVEQPVRKGTVVVGEYGDSLEEAAKKAAKLRDEVAKVNASVLPLTTSIAGLSESQVANITPAEALRVNLNAIEDATIGLTAENFRLRDETGKLVIGWQQNLIPGAIEVSGRLADIENAGVATAASLTTIGEGATSSVPPVNSLKASLLSMAQVAIAAGAALIGVLSNKAGFGSVATTAVSIGTGLAGAAIAASAWGASMTAAGVAGSIALGAATLGVGLAVVGVIALVKWLNNGRDKVRDMTAEVIRLNGGFDVLAFKIHAATGETVLFERLLAAGNEKEYEAAIDAVSQALAALEERMTELRATAETTVDTMGALRGLTPGLKVALDGLYNAKTPQEYADAIGRVNLEIDEALRKQQALDTSLGNLKASWEILGPTARAQYLGEWATGVKQDIDNVVEAGADLNYTIGLAGPELSKIVQAAKRSGTEIPAALQPILMQAAALGVLFDEDGKKIQSLEGYGVHFGTTFEENMMVVKDAMLEVVGVLEDIRDTLLGIPSQRTIRITVQQKLETSGITLADKEALFWAPKHLGGVVMHEGGPVGRMLKFIPRAHNGLAIGEVPIIAQRGEVMFSRANVAAMGGVGATEAFRRGLGGGSRGSVVNFSTARLEAQIEALRKQQTKADEQQAARDRMMPALFGIAARDAVQQQARRR